MKDKIAQLLLISWQVKHFLRSSNIKGLKKKKRNEKKPKTKKAIE